MVIIQLVVPSARGTNAGSLRIPKRTGTAEFTRLDVRAQGIFVGKVFLVSNATAHSYIEMRGAPAGYED